MSEAEQVLQRVTQILKTPMTDEEREQKIMAEVLNAEGAPKPTVGREVWYQTDGRNGLDYYLPATVTVTKDSHPGDYPDGTPNSLPVPSSDLHVHLTVKTPGGFGSTYVDHDGTESEYEQETMPNLGKPASFTPGSGTYVEHDVPFDPNGGRRTWRWPDRA